MLGFLVSFLSIFSRKLTPLNIMAKERTFIAIKPDGVQRGLIGDIIKRFENKGFKLAGMKFMQGSEEHFKKHYADLSDKPFFNGLVKYMSTAPVLAMCWEGTDVVKTARKMMGETKPGDSLPGTIRGDFCIEVGRNIIHGSDSVDSANKEIALWFKPEELVNWSSATENWVYEVACKFSKLTDEFGMRSLNLHLQNRSYISEYVPSFLDVEVFKLIHKDVSRNLYPHVFRWHKHIRFIYLDIKVVSNHCEKDFLKPRCEIGNCSLVTKSDCAKKEKQNLSKRGKKNSKILKTTTKEQSISNKEFKNSFKEEKDFDDRTIKNVEFSKYSIVIEVRPRDETIKMTDVENIVRGVTLKGVKWGNSQLTSVSYGVGKLSIICLFETNDSSILEVFDTLLKFEDYIKGVDISAFSKF